MTRNTLLSKIKIRIILALIIVGILCTSLFFLTACSEDDDSNTIPSYSYTDTDDGLISNPDFNYNTSSIKLQNYPQTSPTGWSRSKDTDGNSSSAKSGVIDISPDGWSALLDSFYSDSYYVDYLGNKLGFNKSDIEEKAKEDNSSITADELKELVVAKYKEKLTAPALQSGATDNKVYMLNNYTNKIGFGSSQKITSKNEITIKKGEYVKISVDVLTQNIVTKDASDNDVVLGLDGANNEFGASIRLTNTFNSEKQAEYAVTNINTNGAWKTYTLYAKADTEYDCTVTLALGLGYSNLYPTEGTVYFDNIKVEELETVATLPVATEIDYDSDQAKLINAGSATEFFYDMSLVVDTTYNKSITPTITGELTKNSDGVTSNDKGWTATGSYSNGVATLSNASYSLKIEDTVNFKITREKYAYVSFKLENNLSKFGSTNISVGVYEGTEKPAVVLITETGETTVGIMIKNNFDKDDTAFAPYDERSFHIVIVIGPSNISANDKLSAYASGNVRISDFKIAKGDTYQYTDDTNQTETDNYKYYKLFNSVADGSTSLYAGFDNDYISTSQESTSSTGFGVASTYREYLSRQLVAPSEYDGVETNHIYLTSQTGASSAINTRLKGDTNGNYAGIIDTKFYNNSGFNKPSNVPTLDEDIRPLMIYNNNADSYGFIYNKDAQVVSDNSFAKVSVTLRVDDNAKAFVYLVDTTSKEVMKFNTFTPNSNGISQIAGNEKVGEQFVFEVGNTNGEWVDVDFFIATGTAEKSFRIELWNGSRDGANKSQGYVFFKSVIVSLSNGFTEPTSFKTTFTDANSPLYAKESSFIGANSEYLCYSRPLTELEKQFNEEYSDQAVSYAPKVIWAKNDNILYAVFNTLDVEATDPYDSIVEEEPDEESSGCAAETDPATFWLSFSSILLAVVLVLLIGIIIVRNVRRKRKANASDAKSHYTVKSRVRTAPKAKKEVSKKKVEEEEKETIEPEVQEETTEEVVEQSESTEPEVQEESKEQTLDEYVYGDVQDFGETETNEDKE